MKNKDISRLSSIAARLNGFSALSAVVCDAVEKVGRVHEDAETAHIEMVLTSLNYDLAAIAEEIEKMLEVKS
ncbi:hypothetical protein [Thiothrix lacustris]|uniref:hypothetical protein n=1 Tax=Thiothrix lacustris TaxID=525917 RepID=UPI0027E3C5DC|nr:hypothetical protein [Thiothrix lacustris]WMP17341.1 hypothetical protein RCS87_18430 [Thiothrix lacustris]